jgi:hypothetical protein
MYRDTIAADTLQDTEIPLKIYEFGQKDGRSGQKNKRLVNQ